MVSTITLQVKDVTAIRKGRFTGQVCLTIGDYRIAEIRKIPHSDPSETDEAVQFTEEVIGIENKEFDWLCDLKGKTIKVVKGD